MINGEENEIKGVFVWFRSHWSPKTELVIDRKFFARYVDEVVWTTKSTSDEMLGKANAFQENLHFTLEGVDGNGELAFLDMCISEENKISVHAIGTVSQQIPP